MRRDITMKLCFLICYRVHRRVPHKNQYLSTGIDVHILIQNIIHKYNNQQKNLIIFNHNLYSKAY